jgi:hypothetical protein
MYDQRLPRARGVFEAPNAGGLLQQTFSDDFTKMEISYFDLLSCVGLVPSYFTVG